MTARKLRFRPTHREVVETLDGNEIGVVELDGEIGWKWSLWGPRGSSLTWGNQGLVSQTKARAELLKSYRRLVRWGYL